MTTKKQPSIRVILKLPHKIADLLVRAQQIHDAMAANAIVLSSPDPVLTKLQSDIDALVTKEAAAKSHAVGATADRDGARDVVTNDLHSERAYVEKVANASPGDALVIAQDASMQLRKGPTRSKTDLAIKRGAVTGEVKVVAKATKGAKQNVWQQSPSTRTFSGRGSPRSATVDSSCCCSWAVSSRETVKTRTRFSFVMETSGRCGGKRTVNSRTTSSLVRTAP